MIVKLGPPEALKFLEPLRQDAFCALRRAVSELRDMTDGRDLRPNYDAIQATAAEIVRLQKTCDLINGYDVEL